MISEEILAFQPDITALHVADVLVNYLRTRLHIGPWEELRLKIAMTLVNGPVMDYAPPREDMHYKDGAPSEFEGVEGLDESLWSNSGDIL